MTNRRSSSPTAARGGRAIGAMFYSVFGGLWLALWGYSEFASPFLVLSALSVGTLALLFWSIATYRKNSAALRSESQTPQARRRSRLFNWINAGQWVVIFILVAILVRLRRQDLIFPAVILVIGLHFIPMARLFSYRPHYVTGLSLVVLALAYPVLSAGGGQSSHGALGTGAVLWLSAIWALLPDLTPEAGTCGRQSVPGDQGSDVRGGAG